MEEGQITSVEAGNLEAQGQQVTGGNDQQQQHAAVVGSQQQIPPADELYEVKVNGRTFKVPKDELVSGYQRQQDYTAKTMEAAEYRRAADQQVSAMREEMERVGRFLSDPRVQHALKNLATQQVDPNQPLTPEALNQQLQWQQQQMDQRMYQMANDLEVRSLANQYTGELDTTIKGILDKHPVLQDIDGIDDLLKRDVAKQQPENIAEAKQMLISVAQQRAARIEGRFQTQQKEQLVQQQKLQTNGIERGGVSPQIAPEGKRFKLGTNDLLQAAINEYTQATARV